MEVGRWVAVGGRIVAVGRNVLVGGTLVNVGRGVEVGRGVLVEVGRSVLVEVGCGVLVGSKIEVAEGRGVSVTVGCDVRVEASVEVSCEEIRDSDPLLATYVSMVKDRVPVPVGVAVHVGPVTGMRFSDLVANANTES